MRYTITDGLLTFAMPPRVSAIKPTTAQRTAHRKYLDWALDEAFALAAAQLDARTLSEKDERDLKTLRRRAGDRRAPGIRDESLLVALAQDLVFRLSGAKAVAGTPLQLSPSRNSAAPSTRTLAQASVMTLKDAKELKNLVMEMRTGTLGAEEWDAACRPDMSRTPSALTLGALTVIPDDAKSPRLTDQAAYITARLRDPSADPKAVMRAITKERLTQRDYKRIVAWEKSPGLMQQNVGQRTRYVLVPILRALLLFLCTRHRGATSGAMLEVLEKELRHLQDMAAAAGAPFLIANPTAEDAQTPTGGPDVQLELDAKSTAPVSIEARPTVTLPNIRTVQRFRKELPQRLRDAHALGLENVKRNFRPIDAIWVAACSNECWQFDNTELDVMISDDRPGREGSPHKKPWITVVIDEFSRRILSYHVWYQTPDATGIAYALYNAIMPAPQLGRPDGCLPMAIRIDRGAEYVSDKFTSVVAALGIDLEICRPHRPDDKAVIERAFGSMLSRLSAQPGYTKAPGAHLNTLSKVGPGAVLSFHELLTWLDAQVVRYNNTVHSTTNEKPIDLWTHASGWDMPSDNDLVFRLLWSNVTPTITTKGVRYRGHFYNGDLTHPDGRKNFELIGRKVRLYFIPGYISQVLVCMANDETQSAQTPEVFLGVLRSNANGLARVDLESQFHVSKRDLSETFKTLANPASRLTVPPQLALPLPSAPAALPTPTQPRALGPGEVTHVPVPDEPAPITAAVQDPDDDDSEAAFFAKARARYQRTSS